MSQNQINQIKKKVKIFSFDGSIGSGKTTLMERTKEYYKTNPNVIFAREPIDKWNLVKDKNGTEMLTLFYADQQKYAFSFQVMAITSRISVFREIINANLDKDIIIITERSLYTDKHIFAKMLYDQGKMSEVEYQIYLSLFNEFVDEFDVENVVYIKTEPAKCYERIHKRAREGEELISLSYLEECHKYHEIFLDQTNGLFKQQLELDGNQDIYKNTNLADEWMSQINAFIEKIL
jgi:deoxyadenosine/deoxycytidine kinase